MSKTETIPCRTGGEPHAAEFVPGTTQTYVYAGHRGAWTSTCAQHSGICHEDCWAERLYPELRPRVAGNVTP